MFLVIALGACAYSGSTLFRDGWIDKATGNLTKTQFHEDNILAGGCNAITGPSTWTQMERKLNTCSRDQYYDPLHNDCFQCVPFTTKEKIFAAYWETQDNCTKVCEFVIKFLSRFSSFLGINNLML